MFGYVTINTAVLDEQAKARYGAFYCGLCKTLKERYGNQGRITLSNDMTFLYILLTALYEPEERGTQGLCVLHPGKKRPFLQNDFSAYVADMNLALAYHKCLDNWTDDHSRAGLLQARLLEKAYAKVSASHPQKCAFIAQCLKASDELEKTPGASIDAMANQTGLLLGELYALQNDYWSGLMRAMGEALGRFIYVMDAYEDLPADLAKGRFNPLIVYHEQPQYEELMKDSLTLLISECTSAFELLPITQDVDILRNVLYSGIWSRYAALLRKAEKNKLVKKEERP